MARKPPTTDEVDAALARWRTKLKRAFGTIEKLEKQRKRIEKKPPPPTMIAVAAPQNPKPYVPGQSMAAKVDDALHGNVELEIPDWLKRTGPIGDKTPADLRDLETRIEIETEQANKRIAKSRARIEKMKAKKAGDLKKMPLSGKAALDMIKNG